MNIGTSALLVASLLVAAPAFAAPQTPAEQHFAEAMQLFQDGEVEHACTVFEQSYTESAKPGTLYNLSICREQQGQYGDAYRGFDELATRAEESNLPEKAASVRARANALQPKLARIDLVHRADARADVTSLTIDGTVLLANAWKRPLYVMPGVHKILIKHADGTNVLRTTRTVIAGDSQSIEMEDPAPLPDAPAGPDASAPIVVHDGPRVDAKKRTASFIVGGAGIALVGAGAVFGILTVAKKNSAQARCNGDDHCPSADESAASNHDIRVGRTFATVSTIGFAAGGAALAGGIYLFLTSRESTPRTGAALAGPQVTRFLPSYDPLSRGSGIAVQGTF